MFKPKRVVITGMGPVTSIGVGVKDLWQAILEKKTGLEQVESLVGGELWARYYAHSLKNFNLEDFNLNQDVLGYIKNWQEGSINVDLQYLLAAIKLALDDAKIDFCIDQEQDSLGIIVAHENPGMEEFVYKIFNETFDSLASSSGITKRQFFNDVYYKIVKSGYETQSFMTLFHIAKVFNVHRYSFFINNACASGLYALELASNIIALEKKSMVVVSAADHSNVFKYLWFQSLNMYEEDGRIKPFSKDGKGLVMGDGAAAIVLEEYEHALKRNAYIYAEYIGGELVLEGWQISRPMIGGDSYHKAIEGALTKNCVSKSEIDLLCLHGFGSQVGDFYEAKAVMDIFNNEIPVTAFKPYIGHNLGGSSLIESVILLLALKNNIIPPILNTTEINPKVQLDLVLKQRQCFLKQVMKTCSAFAGYNAAAIFKKINY